MDNASMQSVCLNAGFTKLLGSGRKNSMLLYWGFLYFFVAYEKKSLYNDAIFLKYNGGNSYDR